METGALPNYKKEAFNWSTQSAFFFLSFSSVFQCSYRLCSHCTLRLWPAEDLLFIQHTQVANENSRRSSRTKTHSAHIRQHVIRTGDMEQRREGGTEATDLLTGQLEGANRLAELNIPDRVGMQQGDGPSRGFAQWGAMGVFMLTELPG